MNIVSNISGGTNSSGLTIFIPPQVPDILPRHPLPQRPISHDHITIIETREIVERALAEYEAAFKAMEASALNLRSIVQSKQKDLAACNVSGKMNVEKDNLLSTCVNTENEMGALFEWLAKCPLPRLDDHPLKGSPRKKADFLLRKYQSGNECQSPSSQYLEPLMLAKMSEEAVALARSLQEEARLEKKRDEVFADIQCMYVSLKSRYDQNAGRIEATGLSEKFVGDLKTVRTIYLQLYSSVAIDRLKKGIDGKFLEIFLMECNEGELKEFYEKIFDLNLDLKVFLVEAVKEGSYRTVELIAQSVQRNDDETENEKWEKATSEALKLVLLAPYENEVKEKICHSICKTGASARKLDVSHLLGKDSMKASWGFLMTLAHAGLDMLSQKASFYANRSLSTPEKIELWKKYEKIFMQRNYSKQHALRFLLTSLIGEILKIKSLETKDNVAVALIAEYVGGSEKSGRSQIYKFSVEAAANN